MKKLISHRFFVPVTLFAASALVALVVIQFLPSEKRSVPQVPAPTVSVAPMPVPMVVEGPKQSVCLHLRDQAGHPMVGCRVDFAQLKPDPLPQKDTTGSCLASGDYFFEVPAGTYTVFAFCDGGSTGKIFVHTQDYETAVHQDGFVY